MGVLLACETDKTGSIALYAQYAGYHEKVRTIYIVILSGSYNGTTFTSFLRIVRQYSQCLNIMGLCLASLTDFQFHIR